VTDLERLANITDRDRELNTWATRSFRDVADGDYIAARLAYRAQLPVQFLWASQQALEKYLKCILFIRRVPARSVKHDLEPALKLVAANGIELNLTKRSQEFIERIDAVGQYRYMEASFWVDWHWIVALDQAVWELRRFCTLDPSATSARLVEGRWAPRVRIVGGHLERIMDKSENPAREPLLWHNAYFGRRRRTIMVRGGMTSVNSPLIRTADFIDDILRYAYIPKDVVTVYRDYAAEERQKAKKR
jgi:hypothetical protein